MSLVTLTFGDRGYTGNIEVVRPQDHIKVDSTQNGQVLIQKVDSFIGLEGVYVIAKVMSGIVGEKMTATIQGKTMEVREVENKYPGCKVGKQGMTVGLHLRGVYKEDLEKGMTLSFD